MSEIVAMAKEFCEEIEEGLEGALSDSARRMIHLLSQLISTAIRLPEVDLNEDGEDPEVVEVSAQEYEIVRQKISSSFGAWGYYWTLPIRPFDGQDEPEMMVGDVVDDLADIWRELKRGLRIWAKGSDYEALALWHWRFSFEAHWGTHAVDALRIIMAAQKENNEFK